MLEGQVVKVAVVTSAVGLRGVVLLAVGQYETVGPQMAVLRLVVAGLLLGPELRGRVVLVAVVELQGGVRVLVAVELRGVGQQVAVHPLVAVLQAAVGCALPGAAGPLAAGPQALVTHAVCASHHDLVGVHVTRECRL